VRFDETLDQEFRASSEWKQHLGSGALVPLYSQKPNGDWEANSFSGGERNRFFLSQGGQQFRDFSAISGVDHSGDGRTFCLADFDHDGWMDIVLVNSNAPSFKLYRNAFSSLLNEDQKGHFLKVRLTGGAQQSSTSKTLSNRNAYGSIVEVHCAGGQKFKRALVCGAGFAGQNSRTLHFGLGQLSEIKNLIVKWPSGKKHVVGPMPVNQTISLHEVEDEP